MTLLYFDGFDLHTRVITGLDPGAGGAQDAGKYWSAGTTTRYDFPAGYLGGQGFEVSPSGLDTAGSGGPIRSGKVYRAGFWAKFSNSRTLSLIEFETSAFSWKIQYQYNTSANLYQIKVGGAIVGTSPLAPDFNEWEYYEVYCNGESGTYQLYRNKVLLISVSNAGTPPPPWNTRALTLRLGDLDHNPLAPTPTYVVDHFWVTTGEYPAGAGILGVQVVSAVDKYQSTNDGFVGSLVINGSRYVSDFNSAIATSRPNIGPTGRNIANVLNFLFEKDPSTGSPWSILSYNLIDKWGLCYQQRGWGNPGVQRVAGLLLATLEDNNGRPIVRNRKVDGSGEFSGPWTRSDEGKSFSWHLQNVPRLNKPTVPEVPALFIGNDGCALFNGPSKSAVVPEFQDIGLTFAEEFREDYKDWVRVDGLGVSFDSFFVSGYSVLGEGNRKFQDNYVTINYENIPTGQAFIQGLWDYAEKSSTGRWSNRQVIENKGGDYKHAHRRLKIRGHGKALSIRVSNRGDFPFIINGWTALVSSNQNV